MHSYTDHLLRLIYVAITYITQGTNPALARAIQTCTHLSICVPVKGGPKGKICPLAIIYLLFLNCTNLDLQGFDLHNEIVQ